MKIPAVRRDLGVWQQFLQTPLTVPTTRREYPEWHRGRARFCVWGLLPESRALDASVQALRARLADYLLLPYPRQPHITLQACGFWPSASAAEDDYPDAQLMQHRRALEALALPRFTLTVGALNSFSSALYLEVDDSQQYLAAIRACLPGFFETIRAVPFVPHVTLGVYRQAWDCRQLAAVLEALPQPPLTLEISAIQLLSYDARDIGSALQVEAEIALR